MQLSFPKRLFRDPWLSEVTLLRLEDGMDCDGLDCLGREDSCFNLHRHLVVSGVNPAAGPRCYQVE